MISVQLKRFMASATVTTNNKIMANAEIDMASDINVSESGRDESKKKRTIFKRFLWSSALARRIIAFNLIALCTLLLGMLYLSQFSNNIADERFAALKVQSNLYAQILQERATKTTDAVSANDALLSAMVDDLPAAGATEVRIFDANNVALTTIAADEAVVMSHETSKFGAALDGILGSLVAPFKNPADATQARDTDEISQSLAAKVLAADAQTLKETTQAGAEIVAAGQLITVNGTTVGTVVASTPAGLMDNLRAQERNNILRLFVFAAILSVVLSLVLANTIANPIHVLASAMDAGTTSKLRKDSPDRVRIPDMTGRDDEIGHLSSAMRNMTSALYHRIETNEQFAADVAHEIKNPLASLRSAIETLRIAPEGEKRNRLLDVVEHDVRRLDRLVSDISNASRLDSELVKEEEDNFDLTLMLERIVDFHSMEAKEAGVEMLFDKPDEKIFIDGLEERLAQVFVNLITNAVSFCEKGDAVRLWARRVENRVLIVVEDTGEGIPDDSLTKVFKRFYSNRSVENFGNNSGLGLSISKEIVEAHGGVIWAENIRAKGAAEDAAPLGARFVVGLPG